MRPASTFPEANRVLTAPDGMENCDPLQVHVTDDFVVSAWDLEPGELEELRRNGGRVYLYVWTQAGTQPPVALHAASPFASSQAVARAVGEEHVTIALPRTIVVKQLAAWEAGQGMSTRSATAFCSAMRAAVPETPGPCVCGKVPHEADCPGGTVTDPACASPGASLIWDERVRQISAEGWTPKHDDEHAEGGYYNQPALPQAAAVYAVTAHQGEKAIVGCQNPGWPWDLEWFKPASPIRMLVKAGALIAAEIDRRLRAGERP